MNSNVNRLLPDEGAGVWVHFSHGSFTINDSAVPFALFKTGPGHANQGFARTESQVMFSTMLEYGRVLLNVYLGPYMPSETYDCVIEVPLRVDSGQVVMSGGPSDLPEGRTVKLPPGDYRLTCAQRVLGGEDDPNPDTRNRIVMDLFFEPAAEAAKTSRILVDKALVAGGLQPPDPLIETVEVITMPWMR